MWEPTSFQVLVRRIPCRPFLKLFTLSNEAHIHKHKTHQTLWGTRCFFFLVFPIFWHYVNSATTIIFTQNYYFLNFFVNEWPKNNIHLSFLSYKETWLTWSNHLCCCWGNFGNVTHYHIDAYIYHCQYTHTTNNKHNIQNNASTQIIWDHTTKDYILNMKKIELAHIEIAL